MSFLSALQNALILAIPAGAYIVFMLLRHRLPAKEIGARLGLFGGHRRIYLLAILLAVPAAAITSFVASRTSGFEGSLVAPFVGQRPSVGLFSQAVWYGFIATGIPEELLFRGLIGGALFRRLRFWWANILQAAVFTVPHLLILLVDADLWILATAMPFGLGLALGWLRNAGDSIWPPALLHAIPNVAGALWLLNWTGGD